MIDRDDIISYCGRAWGEAREAKERYWAREAERCGPSLALELGAALWRHAKLVDPSWPTEAERRADLEHHARLAGRLQRLAHVFARR